MKDVPEVLINDAYRINGENSTIIYINQSEKSPLIGECIYCGSQDDLSDEHTIPLALNGIAKLKNASCGDCRKLTQKLEQRVLRDTFGQVREYLNFKSRKAKKSGRWTGQRQVKNVRTNSNETVALTDGMIALWLLYPDYPPRALGAEQLDERHTRRSMVMLPLNPPTRILPDHIEDSWVPINASDIERCIAKIGYCELIRVVDNNIRDKSISDFILNGSTDFSYFLGGKAGDPPSDNMHTITFQKSVPNDPADQRRCWLVNVQLFSFLPTPTFRLIVGLG